MEDQQKFIEMMQDVVELAKINNREVTKEFLQDFFKELQLNDEQMESVYEYLIQENIHVAGFKGKKHLKDETASLQEEPEPGKAYEKESEHLRQYIEEVERLRSKDQALDEWYQKAASGDAQAKAFIIEQKLGRVVQIAAHFKNQGMAQGDLIQEGNVGLLLAVEQLSGKLDRADEFLDEEIKRSMLEAIDLYKEERRENHGLMKRAETLKEEMEKLSENLGDKMTSEDVAQFIDMDREEIQGLLGMMGDDC